MLALKDIEGICPTLGNTPLSKSPIWNTPVDQIIPAQLTAYRTKMALAGQASEANAAIQFALRCVMIAARQGKIDMVGMLHYSEPRDTTITAGMLKRGFATMKRPRPAAILFGLESGLEIEQIISLTWEKAKRLTLTPYAKRILDSQPIHIRCPYVFWSERAGKPQPLFGLSQEVFEVLGVVWGELAIAYNQIVLVDEDVEREIFASNWR